jgi:apyrase
MPVVSDVFSESVKPGLSSYAGQPESAGDSLKKLFDDAVQFLQKNNVDVKTVPMNIYGTAGMRLLSEENQEAIYANITYYLKKNKYQFGTPDAKTISGKMEGLYGWLDVNYLSENFQNHQSTLGSIDMGGASTQIAFATDDQSKPDDEISVTINNQTYRVFSKSFLRLGQDQARDKMSSDPEASACYPTNYPFSSGVGKFDFATCKPIYENIIKDKQVAEQIISSPDHFVAYSGIYFTYNFFNMDQTPEQAILESRIGTVCSESWEQLQKDYPTVAAPYLSAYCANGVYQDQLLYSTYQLQGKQMTVVNQINQTGIDWTLGAAVYSLLQA